MTRKVKTPEDFINQLSKKVEKEYNTKLNLGVLLSLVELRMRVMLDNELNSHLSVLSMDELRNVHLKINEMLDAKEESIELKKSRGKKGKSDLH